MQHKPVAVDLQKGAKCEPQAELNPASSALRTQASLYTRTGASGDVPCHYSVLCAQHEHPQHAGFVQLHCWSADQKLALPGRSPDSMVRFYASSAVSMPSNRAVAERRRMPVPKSLDHRRDVLQASPGFVRALHSCLHIHF